MRNMTAGELHIFYDKHECPSCGGNDFLAGPRGGLMENVKCAACGMTLNVSQSGTIRIGQVVSASDDYVPPPPPLPIEDSSGAGAAPNTAIPTRLAALLSVGSALLALSSALLAITSVGSMIAFYNAALSTQSPALSYVGLASAIAISAAAAAVLGMCSKWTRDKAFPSNNAGKRKP